MREEELTFMVKKIAFFADFSIINAWQHFGNKKSVDQNKLCNRINKPVNLQQNLNKIIQFTSGTYRA